jgi:membrane protein
MSSGDRGADEVDAVDTREVDPAEVDALRADLEELAADLDEKTMAREDLESDLRRYVRWRQRRGHAHGWGPYLVLLYGTIMTLGAFYLLSGGWAVLAMVVVWLSTLGLYALMVIVGLLTTGVGLPGRVLERLRSLR